MKKMYALFVCSCLFSAGAVTGQTVRGYVRDSLAAPIPFASIVASGCSDDRVLGFTSTDDKGFYSLAIPADCDTITLTARALGYLPSVRRAASRAAAGAPLDFVLSSIGMPLREVVIRGETPPVVVRNDTTEYHVASFSDSTEFSVEDLLKKLPGARVSETGVITLNGKTVERVLIEGDDLFNQNYPLATRNIRADMVSKVQAIDRYQENPLLKGLQESDRLVLNLKIKEEKKRATSGSIMAGGGFGDAWKAYAHTNLFSLSRRDKIYLIGNANNTGENSLSDIQSLSGDYTPTRQNQSIQNSPFDRQELLRTPEPETVGLPAPFGQTNYTGLLFAGYVLPVTPAFKIKITGWIAEEQLRQQSAYNGRYLLDQSILELSENQTLRRQSGVRQAQIETDYFAPDNRHGLRAFFKTGARPQSHSLGLLRTQNPAPDDTFRINNNGASRPYETHGAIEYSYKTGENTLLQLTGRGGRLRNRQVLYSDYSPYALFFGLGPGYTQLQQQVQPAQWAGSLSAKYLVRDGPVQGSIEAGLDWQHTGLLSDLLVSNAAGEGWAPANADYRNDFRWTAPRYFAGLTASRRFGPVFGRVRLGGSYTPVRHRRTGFQDKSVRLLAAAPRVDLRYTVSEKAIWTAYYGFEQQQPGLADVYPAYIFTDYQHVARGLSDFTLLPGHRAGMMFRFQNAIRQFSWNIGGNTTIADGQFGTAYQIDPFLFIQQKIKPVRTEQYAMQGSINRYFRGISSRFEIGAALIVLQEQDKINSELLRDFDTRNYSLRFGYGTAFDGWVNFLLSNQYSRVVVRNIQAQSVGALRTANTFSSLQITVKPSSRFFLKTYVYRAANRIETRPPTVFYAAQGVCALQLPRWNSQVQLSGMNLLGARRFEQVFADGFSRNSTFITAVRPFFLLTWEIGF